MNPATRKRETTESEAVLDRAMSLPHPNPLSIDPQDPVMEKQRLSPNLSPLDALSSSQREAQEDAQDLGMIPGATSRSVSSVIVTCCSIGTENSCAASISTDTVGPQRTYASSVDGPLGSGLPRVLMQSCLSQLVDSTDQAVVPLSNVLDGMMCPVLVVREDYLNAGQTTPGMKVGAHEGHSFHYPIVSANSLAVALLSGTTPGNSSGTSCTGGDERSDASVCVSSPGGRSCATLSPPAVETSAAHFLRPLVRSLSLGSSLPHKSSSTFLQDSCSTAEPTNCDASGNSSFSTTVRSTAASAKYRPKGSRGHTLRMKRRVSIGSSIRSVSIHSHSAPRGLESIYGIEINGVANEESTAGLNGLWLGMAGHLLSSAIASVPEVTSGIRVGGRNSRHGSGIGKAGQREAGSYSLDASRPQLRSFRGASAGSVAAPKSWSSMLGPTDSPNKPVGGARRTDRSKAAHSLVTLRSIQPDHPSYLCLAAKVALNGCEEHVSGNGTGASADSVCLAASVQSINKREKMLPTPAAPHQLAPIHTYLIFIVLKVIPPALLPESNTATTQLAPRHSPKKTASHMKPREHSDWRTSNRRTAAKLKGNSQMPIRREPLNVKMPTHVAVGRSSNAARSAVSTSVPSSKPSTWVPSRSSQSSSDTQLGDVPGVAMRAIFAEQAAASPPLPQTPSSLQSAMMPLSSSAVSQPLREAPVWPGSHWPNPSELRWKRAAVGRTAAHYVGGNRRPSATSSSEGNPLADSPSSGSGSHSLGPQGYPSVTHPPLGVAPPKWISSFLCNAGPPEAKGTSRGSLAHFTKDDAHGTVTQSQNEQSSPFHGRVGQRMHRSSNLLKSPATQTVKPFPRAPSRDVNNAVWSADHTRSTSRSSCHLPLSPRGSLRPVSSELGDSGGLPPFAEPQGPCKWPMGKNSGPRGFQDAASDGEPMLAQDMSFASWQVFPITLGVSPGSATFIASRAPSDMGNSPILPFGSAGYLKSVPQQSKPTNFVQARHQRESHIVPQVHIRSTSFSLPTVVSGGATKHWAGPNENLARASLSSARGHIVEEVTVSDLEKKLRSLPLIRSVTLTERVPKNFLCSSVTLMLLLNELLASSKGSGVHCEVDAVSMNLYLRLFYPKLSNANSDAAGESRAATAEWAGHGGSSRATTTSDAESPPVMTPTVRRAGSAESAEHDTSSNTSAGAAGSRLTPTALEKGEFERHRKRTMLRVGPILRACDASIILEPGVTTIMYPYTTQLRMSLFEGADLISVASTQGASMLGVPTVNAIADAAATATFASAAATCTSVEDVVTSVEDGAIFAASPCATMASEEHTQPVPAVAASVVAGDFEKIHQVLCASPVTTTSPKGGLLPATAAAVEEVLPTYGMTRGLSGRSGGLGVQETLCTSCFRTPLSSTARGRSMQVLSPRVSGSGADPLSMRFTSAVVEGMPRGNPSLGSDSSLIQPVNAAALIMAAAVEQHKRRLAVGAKEDSQPSAASGKDAAEPLPCESSFETLKPDSADWRNDDNDLTVHSGVPCDWDSSEKTAFRIVITPVGARESELVHGDGLKTFFFDSKEMEATMKRGGLPSIVVTRKNNDVVHARTVDTAPMQLMPCDVAKAGEGGIRHVGPAFQDAFSPPTSSRVVESTLSSQLDDSDTKCHSAEFSKPHENSATVPPEALSMTSALAERGHPCMNATSFHSSACGRKSSSSGDAANHTGDDVVATSTSARSLNARATGNVTSMSTSFNPGSVSSISSCGVPNPSGVSTSVPLVIESTFTHELTEERGAMCDENQTKQVLLHSRTTSPPGCASTAVGSGSPSPVSQKSDGLLPQIFSARADVHGWRNAFDVQVGEPGSSEAAPVAEISRYPPRSSSPVAASYQRHSESALSTRLGAVLPLREDLCRSVSRADAEEQERCAQATEQHKPRGSDLSAAVHLSGLSDAESPHAQSSWGDSNDPRRPSGRSAPDHSSPHYLEVPSFQQHYVFNGTSIASLGDESEKPLPMWGSVNPDRLNSANRRDSSSFVSLFNGAATADSSNEARPSAEPGRRISEVLRRRYHDGLTQDALGESRKSSESNMHDDKPGWRLHIFYVMESLPQSARDWCYEAGHSATVVSSAEEAMRYFKVGMSGFDIVVVEWTNDRVLDDAARKYIFQRTWKETIVLYFCPPPARASLSQGRSSDGKDSTASSFTQSSPSGTLLSPFLRRPVSNVAAERSGGTSTSVRDSPKSVHVSSQGSTGAAAPFEVSSLSRRLSTAADDVTAAKDEDDMEFVFQKQLARYNELISVLLRSDVPEGAIITNPNIASAVDDPQFHAKVSRYFRQSRMRLALKRDIQPRRRHIILRQIGSGAFGEVFEVFLFVSKGRLAMKRLLLVGASERTLEQFYREVTIMQELDHPNVVAYSHCMIKEDSFCLFMELCEGSLAERLQQQQIEHQQRLKQKRSRHSQREQPTKASVLHSPTSQTSPSSRADRAPPMPIFGDELYDHDTESVSTTSAADPGVRALLHLRRRRDGGILRQKVIPTGVPRRKAASKGCATPAKRCTNTRLSHRNISFMSFADGSELGDNDRSMSDGQHLHWDEHDTITDFEADANSADNDGRTCGDEHPGSANGEEPLRFNADGDDEDDSWLKSAHINPVEAVLILHDIASGVAYLHKMGYVHRDLKPANVLFNGGVAKLADFGSAAQDRAEDHHSLHNMKGTLAYMSPEVLLGEPYGKSCDMWSVGCLIADVIGLRLGHLKGLHVPALTELYRSISRDESLPITVSEHKAGGFENYISAETTVAILKAMKSATRLRGILCNQVPATSGEQTTSLTSKSAGTSTRTVPTSDAGDPRGGRSRPNAVVGFVGASAPLFTSNPLGMAQSGALGNSLLSAGSHSSASQRFSSTGVGSTASENDMSQHAGGRHSSAWEQWVRGTDAPMGPGGTSPNTLSVHSHSATPLVRVTSEVAHPAEVKPALVGGKQSRTLMENSFLSLHTANREPSSFLDAVPVDFVEEGGTSMNVKTVSGNPLLVQLITSDSGSQAAKSEGATASRCEGSIGSTGVEGPGKEKERDAETEPSPALCSSASAKDVRGAHVVDVPTERVRGQGGSARRAISTYTNDSLPAVEKSSSMFKSEEPKRIVTFIATSNVSMCSCSFTHLPESLVELLERCFHRDPAKRITAEELLEHPVTWDVQWMHNAMKAVLESSVPATIASATQSLKRSTISLDPSLDPIPDLVNAASGVTAESRSSALTAKRLGSAEPAYRDGHGLPSLTQDLHGRDELSAPDHGCTSTSASDACLHSFSSHRDPQRQMTGDNAIALADGIPGTSTTGKKTGDAFFDEENGDDTASSRIFASAPEWGVVPTSLGFATSWIPGGESPPIHRGIDMSNRSTSKQGKLAFSGTACSECGASQDGLWKVQPSPGNRKKRLGRLVDSKQDLFSMMEVEVVSSAAHPRLGGSPQFSLAVPLDTCALRKNSVAFGPAKRNKKKRQSNFLPDDVPAESRGRPLATSLAGRFPSPRMDRTVDAEQSFVGNERCSHQ